MSAIKFVEYRDFLNVRKFCLQKMWAYQGHAPLLFSYFQIFSSVPTIQTALCMRHAKAKKKEGKKRAAKNSESKNGNWEVGSPAKASDQDENQNQSAGMLKLSPHTHTHSYPYDVLRRSELRTLGYHFGQQSTYVETKPVSRQELAGVCRAGRLVW